MLAGARSSLARRIGAAARAVFGARRARTPTGHIDEAVGGVLFGWAHAPGARHRRLPVDVFIDGRFVGQGLAHLFRQDLRDAGLGDGRYGFELLVGEALPPDLRGVRAYALGNRRVELASAASARDTSDVATAVDYLRATFAHISTAGQTPAEPLPPPRESGRRWATLFARRPGAGSTNYVAHVVARDGLGAAGDADVLRDYLLRYARRRGRMRAPLAADDISLLNTGPTADAPLARSRAQAMLSRTEPSDDLEAAFVWAAYESASLGVEDCLVPQAQRAFLAAPEENGGETPFPLSRFMRRFLDGLPCLRSLDGGEESQRRLAWLTLTLFATVMPHVLNFLPVAWLERFMAPDQQGVASFDREMQSVFGATGYSAARWRADIARAGYDLARGDFASFTSRGDRIWSAALARGHASAVDVQLIGPFGRRLGISDSCRALAAALQTTGYSLRLCDYTLDHPNDPRSAEGLALEGPGPARVTLLHLNFEDIPAAIAYLPDVFEETRLVAFPYLELSRPDVAHRLGLELVDEIWAASRFIADALASRAPTHLLGTACKPLAAIGRAAARNLVYGDTAKADDFVFLTAGDALSGFHRKNPMGAIAAFRDAFPNDMGVRLVVKTHSRARVGAKEEREAWNAIAQAAQGDPRIVLMDRVVSDDEMAAFLEGADCLVSLHRAEGFGYHLIEAMKLGTPVVATAYSGNLDFCTPETAFLVGYALKPIAPGEYPRASAGQTWAEPDPSSAVAALRAVRDNAAQRAGKIAAARALVERDFSTEAFAARVASRIAEILG